ncbi:MAG: UbiA-like polyprenyltransferase [Thermoplasmata archaeon]
MSFNLKEIIKFIKIEHTIFDLPFAYMGLILSGLFSIRIIVIVGLAATLARVSGMTMNRIMDLPLDSKNPRTKGRALVTGKITIKEAKIILVMSSILFIISAFSLNVLAGLLSPIILLLFYLYPITKKIPGVSHYVLGFSIGSILLAGFIASKDTLPSSLKFYFFMIFISLWIAGFDILYQYQDYLFDSGVGIKSLPVLFDGRITLPLLVNYLISLIFLFLFSFNSYLLILASTIVSIIIIIEISTWKNFDSDAQFKFFNIPVPFILLVFLILDLIIK